jgi:hypothetical protein
MNKNLYLVALLNFIFCAFVMINRRHVSASFAVPICSYVTSQELLDGFS